MKILVTIEGGVLTGVLTDLPGDIEVELLDYDCLDQEGVSNADQERIGEEKIKGLRSLY